jgi:S1-C subfamily serine protease
MRFVYLPLIALLPALAVAGPIDSAAYVKQSDATGYNSGSGTVVAYENNKSLILTCGHVASDPKATFSITLSGKKYDAAYLYGSKVTEKMLEDGTWTMTIDGPDLALLTVAEKLPTVEIASKPAKKGDNVFQWGFPGGRVDTGPYPKVGKVVDADGLWATPDARRGDSGCGLFNADDQLVGVVHSRAADPDEPGALAVPLPTIRKFLHEKATGFPKIQKRMKD